MADVIGAAAGYPILGIALVLLWRLYLEVRRDRDFWRDQALGSTKVAKTSSEVAEKLAVTPTDTEADHKARLAEAVSVLVRELPDLTR